MVVCKQCGLQHGFGSPTSAESAYGSNGQQLSLSASSLRQTTSHNIHEKTPTARTQSSTLPTCAPSQSLAPPLPSSLILFRCPSLSPTRITHYESDWLSCSVVTLFHRACLCLAAVPHTHARACADGGRRPLAAGPRRRRRWAAHPAASPPGRRDRRRRGRDHVHQRGDAPGQRPTPADHHEGGKREACGSGSGGTAASTCMHWARIGRVGKGWERGGLRLVGPGVLGGLACTQHRVREEWQMKSGWTPYALHS